MLTIVFLDVADPVASGFVSSLAHPGGNATGLANINIELSAKRLDLLAAIPRLSRVVVLGCCFGTPVDAILHRFMDETITAAKAMRVSAKPMALRNLDDSPSLFSVIARDGADALIVLPTQRGSAYFLRTQLPELAIKHGLPTMFDDRPMAAAAV